MRQLPQQALKLGDPSDLGHGDRGQAAKAAHRVIPSRLELEPGQNQSSPAPPFSPRETEAWEKAGTTKGLGTWILFILLVTAPRDEN